VFLAGRLPLQPADHLVVRNPHSRCYCDSPRWACLSPYGVAVVPAAAEIGKSDANALAAAVRPAQRSAAQPAPAALPEVSALKGLLACPEHSLRLDSDTPPSV
jgi:hypothetical protein